MKTILIIGASGLVGSRIAKLLPGTYNRIICPTHKELNITHAKNVSNYLSRNSPDVIINFAAISNIDQAEKERGNKNGNAWHLNVSAVRYLVCALPKKSQLIQISTDAVFPGTSERPGPYCETDSPDSDGKHINWYGITKLEAEREVQKLGSRAAIIRISHPFGNHASPRDLLNKTTSNIHAGHAIFADQFFTPTYIKDLSEAIDKIITKKIGGIFHVGCREMTSRFAFDQYFIKKAKLSYKLKKGSMEKFFKKPGSVTRTRLGGFITKKTNLVLGISFHLWQDAIDEYVSEAIRSK